MAVISNNKVPKGTGADVTGLSEGVIYDSGTNVGIGTTSPSGGHLQVEGSKAVYSGYFYNTNTSDGDGLRVRTDYQSGNSVLLNIENAGTDLLQVVGGASGIGNVLVPNGNVGIGTTSPALKLHVSGGSFGAYGAANGTGVRIDGGAAGAMVKLFSDYLSGSDIKLHLSTWGHRNDDGGITIDTAGKVGIGTTSPGARLEIKGDSASGAGSDEKIALKVTNSDSPTARELLSICDAQAVVSLQTKNATVLKSGSGEIWVMPQARTSAAIQEAIDYANTITPKPVVFLPAGVYSVSSTITVHPQMTLMGAGVDATILEVSADIDALVTDDATYGAGGWVAVPSFVVIKGLTVRPTDSNANASHHTAIYIKGGVAPYLENVQVVGIYDSTNLVNRHFKTGIHVKAWEGLLSRCIVKDTYTGFDLSWDSDLWVATVESESDRKSDVTNAVALVGCCYDVFSADSANPTTSITSPPVSAISTAAYNNATGSITSISAAFPTVITSNAHGLSTGDKITIYGSSTSAVNGTWRVRRVDANSFTIPVNVTSAGNNGSWKQEFIRYTTSTPHCLQHGTDVNIAGCQNSNYNGDYSSLYVVDDTHFDVDKASSPGAWQAGGTPQVTGQLIGCYINGHNNTLTGCTLERGLEQISTPKRTVGVFVKGHANSILSCYFENLRTNFKAVSANYLHILNTYRTYYDGFDSDDFVNSGSTGTNIHNGLVGKLTWNGSNWDGSDSSLSGRVGIGTPAPSEKLHIDGNLRLGNEPYLKWSGNALYLEGGQGGDMIHVVELRGSTTNAPRLDIRNAGNSAVNIRLDAGGGASYFNAGHVGIGTTNPPRPLSIAGISNVGINLKDTDSGPEAEFSVGAVAGAVGMSSNHYFYLYTNATERIRITASGAVGIGTTSPGEKLEVSGGNVKVDSNYGFMLGSVKIVSGANTPEGAVTAPVGSLYLRTNGGSGTTLYVKESGTGNMGWVAK